MIICIPLVIFAVSKSGYMEYEKKLIRHRSLCLECGDVIRYGRTDKKFCCEDCKVKHYNQLAKSGRMFRRKVLASLDRNYHILDELLRSGNDKAELISLTARGFVPGIVTSCRKSGSHIQYGCYDIVYIMTPTKVYSIMKIQNLYVPL